MKDLLEMNVLPCLAAAVAVVLFARGALAVPSKSEDMGRLHRWITSWFRSAEVSEPPFSFVYDGRPSRGLVGTWRRAATRNRLDDQRTEHVLTFTDPDTGLEVRCEAIVYSDFPAVEWVAYLANRGTDDTPILEDIRALDVSLDVESGTGVVLHYSRGGIWDARAFEPLEETLSSGKTLEMSTIRTESVGPRDFAGGAGGLSSDPYLPFFNLSCGNEGVIVALGWTGHWEVRFQRSTPELLQMRAGMARTHLKLHPGEEIRTPLVLMLSWRGDVIDGQNLFRRMILAHYTPKLKENRFWSSLSSDSWGAQPAAEQLEKIRLITGHELPIDYYWIDGGWAEGNRPNSYAEWSKNVGNWGDSKEVYPDGVSAIGKAVHEAGMKFVLWVEPTRVYEGTRIFREHPEWILHPSPEMPEFFAASKLFDLTQPDAVDWIVDLVSRKITEVGADVIWSDFCVEDPLDYWRVDEPDDRQGMREIRYVQGFYRHWDELLLRHPGLGIINCAGGGRMIDLELMKRSVPLWTSDIMCFPSATPTAGQCHTFGSLFWLPASGTGCMRPDTYNWRSNMRSTAMVRWWLIGKIPDDFPFDWLKRMLEEHKAVRDYYEGDFYPLTEYSLKESVWMAYQMHRPDLDEGMVVAFRRSESPYESARFKLGGLKEDSRYEVANFDVPGTTELTGRELLQAGLLVKLEAQPGSAIITYKPLAAK